jgi:hypothetical protein
MGRHSDPDALRHTLVWRSGKGTGRKEHRAAAERRRRRPMAAAPSSLSARPIPPAAPAGRSWLQALPLGAPPAVSRKEAATERGAARAVLSAVHDVCVELFMYHIGESQGVGNGFTRMYACAHACGCLHPRVAPKKCYSGCCCICRSDQRARVLARRAKPGRGP